MYSYVTTVFKNGSRIPFETKNVISVKLENEGQILTIETIGRTVFIDVTDISHVTCFKSDLKGHKRNTYF